MDADNGVEEFIARGISDARLTQYLEDTDGDEQRALELYEWSSRMSSECFRIIGHLEILLRNAIDNELKRYYHEEECGIPWFLQISSPLGDRNQDIINHVREQLRNNRKPDARDRIIASLTFGFWSSLFRKEYDNNLWKPILHHIFSRGTNPKVKRSEVSRLVESIRVTRNHAAHQNYMRDFDVRKAMNDVFNLAELISPEYCAWMKSHSRWEQIYNSCPEIALDTVIVPGRVAWDIYQKQPIYVCHIGRFFRDSQYLGFYESKTIRQQIPHIRKIYEKVEWNEENAKRLLSSKDKSDQILGKAIHWALTPEGIKTAHGWKDSQQGYKVFLLTGPRKHSETTESGKHFVLQNDIPHRHSTAFVQNHRYVSSHALLNAESTDALIPKKHNPLV